MVLNYGINNHLPLDCLNFPKATHKNDKNNGLHQKNTKHRGFL